MNAVAAVRQVRKYGSINIVSRCRPYSSKIKICAHLSHAW